MTNELDARIRALVREVVDRTPTAPEPALAPVGPRYRRRRATSVLAALGAMLVVSVLVVTLAITRDNGDPVAPGRTASDRVVVDVASIPAGVTASAVGGRRVFFVRVGDDVTVLRNRAQHLPGERVWWCPTAQVFRAPTHGETFDFDGTRLGGPARRGLDRFTTRVRGSQLVIHFDSVVEGVAAPQIDSSRGDYPGGTRPGIECRDGVPNPDGAPLRS